MCWHVMTFQLQIATSGLSNGGKGRLGFDASDVCLRGFRPGPEVINLFFHVLNANEHVIYHAHNC